MGLDPLDWIVDHLLDKFIQKDPKKRVWGKLFLRETYWMNRTHANYLLALEERWKGLAFSELSDDLDANPDRYENTLAYLRTQGSLLGADPEQHLKTFNISDNTRARLKNELRRVPMEMSLIAVWVYINAMSTTRALFSLSVPLFRRLNYCGGITLGCGAAYMYGRANMHFSVPIALMKDRKSEMRPELYRLFYLKYPKHRIFRYVNDGGGPRIRQMLTFLATLKKPVYLHE